MQPELDPVQTKRYYRKVFRISAHQSPNVLYAEAEKARGLEPSGTIVIPGVVSYEQLQKNLKLWENDPAQVSVCINAEFYEGVASKLFPSAWLDRANRIAAKLSVTPWIKPNPAKRETLAKGIRNGKVYLAVDTAEGGDDSVWCAGDEFGLLELRCEKTPDTSAITGITLEIMKKFAIPSERVAFDRGGGGKQHADRLRSQGYAVKTIGFGEKATLTQEYIGAEEEDDLREQKSIYKNRRAQLYAEASILLDPAPVLTDDCQSMNEPRGYGIPAEYAELLRQLAAMPRLRDDEGRLYLPPKNKPSPTYKGQTIKDILGCSPDEADAFVMMVHLLTRPDDEPAWIVSK